MSIKRHISWSSFLNVCDEYRLVVQVLAVCLLSEGQRLFLHWSHKVRIRIIPINKHRQTTYHMWRFFLILLCFCQTGIVVALAFSVTATAILSDLWSKEWKTLLLSLQVGQSGQHQPITGENLRSFFFVFIQTVICALWCAPLIVRWRRLSSTWPRSHSWRFSPGR